MVYWPDMALDTKLTDHEETLHGHSTVLLYVQLFQTDSFPVKAHRSMYGLWFVPPEKLIDSLKVQFPTAEVPCVLKHKSHSNGLLAVSVKCRCTNTFVKMHVHVTGLLVCNCGM
jgi:hypothetical protein